MNNLVDDLLILWRFRVTPKPRKALIFFCALGFSDNRLVKSVYRRYSFECEWWWWRSLCSNDCGFVFGIFTIPFSALQPFEAELFTSIYAIELDEFFHIHSLWLESDSIYVAGLFKDDNMVVSWSFRNRWLSVIRFFKTIWFQVTHIYREDNWILICFPKMLFGLQSLLGSIFFHTTFLLLIGMIYLEIKLLDFSFRFFFCSLWFLGFYVFCSFCFVFL